MTSTYKIEAEAIDQKARQEIEENPDLSSRIDKTLPYLCLDMLLKSSNLSINQMVIAAGTPFGIIGKIDALIQKYLEQDLIEVLEVDDTNTAKDEVFYRIADRQKAESLFTDIISKKT